MLPVCPEPDKPSGAVSVEIHRGVGGRVDQEYYLFRSSVDPSEVSPHSGEP